MNNLPIGEIQAIVDEYARPGYTMRIEVVFWCNEVHVTHLSSIGGMRRAWFDADLFSEQRARWEPILRRVMKDIA